MSEEDIKVGSRVYVKRYKITGTVREAPPHMSITVEPDNNGNWFTCYRSEATMIADSVN